MAGLRRLTPAKFPLGESPNAGPEIPIDVDTTPTWYRGTILTLEADAEAIDAATNPATAVCYGVAFEDVIAGVPKGMRHGAHYCRINEDDQYVSSLVNGSDTVATVTAADFGQSYGFRKTTNQGHIVDKSLSGACNVTKVMTEQNCLLVTFDPAVIQPNI